MFLPGAADRREFISAVVSHLHLWKNIFLPHASCSYGYTQLELMGTLFRPSDIYNLRIKKGNQSRVLMSSSWIQSEGQATQYNI